MGVVQDCGPGGVWGYDYVYGCKSQYACHALASQQPLLGVVQ